MRTRSALLWSFLLSIGTMWAAPNDPRADTLADAVIQASGGANWPAVTSIQFTFNVAQGDKQLLTASHRWGVRAGTDTVSWSGKTVTVNVWNPASDPDGRAAYQRWVNDSYWLVAPLKLKDPGVKTAYAGRQVLEGISYDVLHLNFDHVGLTPGDQYNLYIDPDTHLVRRWDYMPAPGKKISGTWGDYREIGGLRISLDRHFGDKHIWFSDVKVERAGTPPR